MKTNDQLLDEFLDANHQHIPVYERSNPEFRKAMSKTAWLVGLNLITLPPK